MGQQKDHAKAGVAFVLACVAIAVVIYVGIKLGRITSAKTPGMSHEVTANFTELSNGIETVPAASAIAAPPSPTEAVQEDVSATWHVLRDEVEQPYLVYGPPDSEGNDSVFCHADRKLLRIEVFDLSDDAGSAVEVSAPGYPVHRVEATFDEGITLIDIPLDAPVLSAMLEGASPLKLSWEGGYVDELPNAPLLTRLISYCRARAG